MFANNTEEQLLALMEGNEPLLSLFEQYQKEISFFLSRMTHDIKNPLTLINSSLQLLEKREPTLTEQPYWNSVKTDVKDLFALLEQLRVFNYGDVLTLAGTNLEKLLIDLSASFEPFAREKNARITINLSDNCHPYIDTYSCDAQKLKEALINLIKNSLEAVEENGLVSLLCSLVEENDKKWLTITVTNTGSTIEPEEYEKLFTPFYTTKAGGTGLGLPTVHKIIAAHKGQLKITSSSDKTSFIIYLPITSSSETA